VELSTDEEELEEAYANIEVNFDESETEEEDYVPTEKVKKRKTSVTDKSASSITKEHTYLQKLEESSNSDAMFSSVDVPELELLEPSGPARWREEGVVAASRGKSFLLHTHPSDPQPIGT
jgi:hypothetical protein